MANEARIQVSLSINNDPLFYQNRPTGFTANVAGKKGPSPGAITVTTSGVNIDFSQLTQAGLCVIRNLSSSYYVELGSYDPDTGVFTELFEILPGESYIFRISRNLGTEYGTGAGTGTSGSGVRMRLKAIGGSCNVSVEAFET